MKKFIRNIFILAAIACTLIILLNYVFQNNYGHYIYHMMNEMYESEDNIDVLFLGSSHVYRSYDTKIADEILGCKTFNAGSSSQGMNTSYYLLKEICKYHDIKTVYLDTYYGMANISDDDSQVFTISDYMRLGENKIEMLKSNGGTETIINGILTVRRGITNLNIVKNLKSRSLDIKDYSSVQYDNEEYRGEGFVYSFEVADAENEATYSGYANNMDLSAEMPVSDLYYDSLLNIIEYCKENKIELVLVNQPMPQKTTDYVIDYNNYVQFIKNIAEENSIEYWNFDLYKYDMGLSMEYYKDGGHLNGEGAEIYTTLFCNIVNDINEGTISSSELFRDKY